MSKLNPTSVPYILRDPTLSSTHLAFSHGGNIWIATRDGKELRRLTSAGREGKPALSPDGRHVAFMGEYGGPRGVFVVSVAGGVPWRVTHHPDDLGHVDWAIYKAGDELGWTPDGKRILFSSRRTTFAGGRTPVLQLFTVPYEGGAVAPVPLVRAAQGSLSPDATRIAYVPHMQSQPEWKRYRGGQTTAIRIAKLADSSLETTIPRENSNDFNPMWVGETIYFLSDRSGPVTLFSYDLESRQVRQLVRHEGLDIKSASALSDAVIYEQFGSLHLLDLSSAEDRVLDIRPAADFPEVRPYFRNLSDIVESEVGFVNIAPKLSPSGAHVAFPVRGEILTVPVREGPAAAGNIRNLTRTPGANERDPAWSPDGRSIAYFSDESGEQALHIRELGGSGSVRRISLGDQPTFYYSPSWSPDGRKISYIDKRLNYCYVDLRTETPVRVDTSFRVDPVSVPQERTWRSPMTWSPDGRWLAYVKVLPSFHHALFLYSLEQAQTCQLTDGMSDVAQAAFDRSGDYLYFTASTDVGLTAEFLGMPKPSRPVSRGVYALLLRKSATLRPPVADAESISETSRNPDPIRVEIDLDGIGGRAVRLPVPARDYSKLHAGRPGTLFLVESPFEQPFAPRPQHVHRFDLVTRKTHRILDNVLYFDPSSEGDHLLYARPADGKRQWVVTSAEIQSSAEPAPCVLKVDSMEVYVEPRTEWTHLFEEAWRIQRDFLYDPGLHGLDLEKTQKQYRPFLANIVCRNDLYYLFGEMLGNLTIGHLWGLPLEDTRRQRAKTGLLGADFVVEQGRYRFARIYERDPWNPAIRSPLRDPETGIHVDAGEFLLAVDGRDVSTSFDLFSWFENTAERQTTLTVGPAPDGSRSRTVTVVPLNNEYPLRYFAWIEDNRRRVEELSGGRVAYVHLPDCGPGGYAAFNRYFFAQIGKEAAIIDNRYNNGGHFPDYIIECLQRSPMSHWHMREGQDMAAPSLNIPGPKVMLTNEMCWSMGDCLPWLFRKAQIGPLVGKRTAGGLVGFYTYVDSLLDHSVLTQPNMAFYTPEGAWEVENRGVAPDFDVDEDPKAARQGRDLQLERAVEVALDLLKKHPPAPQPQRPPYPRYTRKT